MSTTTGSNTTILLVQGDTLPTPIVTIYDEVSGNPVDLTGASIRMIIREVGSSTVKADIPGVLVGNPAGASGQAVFLFGNHMDTPGNFEGEFEVTFPNGNIQTTYATCKIKVRKQIG